MKVAIPYWKGRISPVFDEARCLLVVEFIHRKEERREMRTLGRGGLLERVREIEQMGIQYLVCGAISWPLEMALCEAGIFIVSQTCGLVDEVLSAFIQGRLSKEAFVMPGCNRRRRHGRGRQR